MRIIIRKSLVISVGAAAMLSVIATAASPAAADPPTTPRANDIVSVGNDTIGPLMDQISADYNAQSPAPVNKFFSYDPRASSTPLAPKPGCFARLRPTRNDSAILDLEYNDRPSGNTSNYCVDIAGSSRGRTASDSGLTFAQFAQDAVTWSKTSSATSPSTHPPA